MAIKIPDAFVMIFRKNERFDAIVRADAVLQEFRTNHNFVQEDESLFAMFVGQNINDAEYRAAWWESQGLVDGEDFFFTGRLAHPEILPDILPGWLSFDREQNALICVH